MHLLAEPKLSPPRLLLLRAGASALVVLLITGFWQLQVVRSDYYANLAERNRIRTLPLMAPRGDMEDREGAILVSHYPSYSVILIRDNVEQVQDSLPAIAQGIGLPLKVLKARLEEYADAPPYQTIVLKEEASLADIAFIEAHRIDLPELELLRVYRRRYPPAGFAGHLFGYVGEASPKEVEALGYPLGAVIGKMGLERRYNGLLMGRNGERRVIVDSRGKEVEKLDRLEPVAGRPIRLTLDSDLQQAAEQALAGRQGALVALDPRTGEVLAAVSRPAFDPKLFAVRISAQDWRALTQDPAKPLLNRVTQAQLAPGSVFKVFIATAALEEGVVDEHFTVRCPGWANHYGRVFRCWRPKGHGVVDLHKALVESCDVYFYEVGKRLGIERIARYARQLGLGSRTGIDLPDEKAGLVPSPEWKQRVRKERWYEGETISVAIGQGPVLVTPLQLAYALGGLASGGHFVEPHIVFDPEREPQRRQVALKPDTLRAITDALWGVVNEDGTGQLARLPGVDVAGKTGTAQLISYDTLRRLGGETQRTLVDNAWFVGLAPRRNPEIVVAVLLEHGEHGATAAPAAREVIRAYYDKKRRTAPQRAEAAASSQVSRLGRE